MSEPPWLAAAIAPLIDALIAERLAELASLPAVKPPEPFAFCDRYAYLEGRLGCDPCIRCGGAPNAHIVHDVDTRLQRKRRARLPRVHVPRRPDDERIPADVLARRADPLFGGVFRKLRLVCPAPGCAGYFVVRRRRDRRFKFAGCSTYRETGCTATLGSWEYVERKSAAVDDVLAARTPAHPIRFVIPKPRASKTALPGA